jgi:hypothetical protein
MAKLPEQPRIRYEDLSVQQDAPGWFKTMFTRFLQVINRTLEDMYNAINKGLTFGDNIKAQIIDIDIKSTDFPYKTKNTLGKIQGCLLMFIKEKESDIAVIANAVSITWTSDADSLIILSMPGLTAGTVYSIRLLVI